MSDFAVDGSGRAAPSPERKAFEGLRDKLTAILPDQAALGEALDELVCDVKGKEAADINNGGIDAQLRYLLGEMTADSVVSHVTDEADVKDLGT